MYSKIKWSNFGENLSIIQAWEKILKIAKNPYYLTLRLAANISQKSSAHNFRDINLISCMWGDIADRIK